MSAKFIIPDWMQRAEPPQPRDLSSVDPHRIESMVNDFIAAKQDALFTLPDAFYRQTGADAVDGAPALLDRLARLRQSTLDQAQDDGERALLGPRLDLHLDDARDGIDRHVTKQRDEFARQTISERQALIQRAAELDHNNDDKLGGLAEAHASAAQELARLNGEPEKPAADAARSAIWRTALGQRLANRDHAQAIDLFDRIKDQLAPADRRHLDLPIQVAATDLAADRWIERATATPGGPIAERAAADPDLSPAEKVSVLSKIAERTSATESARFATVKGLDDRHEAATRALATAPASYEPATFLALANAYEDAGEPDKAATARRLAEQENILGRFARSSVAEQQRLVDLLPADAQEAAKVIQQQQDEAFARDPYAAGTALYPVVGPPLPEEDTERRRAQQRIIEAMRGTATEPLTAEMTAEAPSDGPDSNIVRVSLPPSNETSAEPMPDGEQVAQAKKPPPAQPKQAPKLPAPKPGPTPEELAKQAQRRAERLEEFDMILRAPPNSTDSHLLLPDNWKARLDKINPNYARWTKEAAWREGIPPELLARLFYKESYYKAEAASKMGAKGISQLTPLAVEQLGLDPKTFRYTDPKTSIDTGATYLASLYKRFGDWPSAVASYNAGWVWFTQWRNGEDKSGPGAETKTMLQRVFRGDAKAFDANTGSCKTFIGRPSILHAPIKSRKKCELAPFWFT